MDASVLGIERVVPVSPQKDHSASAASWKALGLAGTRAGILWALIAVLVVLLCWRSIGVGSWNGDKSVEGFSCDPGVFGSGGDMGGSNCKALTLKLWNNESVEASANATCLPAACLSNAWTYAKDTNTVAPVFSKADTSDITRW